MSEAIVQIRLLRGKPLYEIRVDGQHDALMDKVIDLGQFMAFILVDDEKISRRDGIKAVVYQKLLSAGNGIIQFVAVMDVHVHGFFFFV